MRASQQPVRSSSSAIVLRELDIVPDYTNVRTSRVVRTLVDFEYPNHDAEYANWQLIERKAVDIDNGIVYIG